MSYPANVEDLGSVLANQARVGHAQLHNDISRILKSLQIFVGTNTLPDPTSLEYRKRDKDDSYSKSQIDILLGLRQLLSEKGQANGYVPLDSGTKIPYIYFPTGVGLGDLLSTNNLSELENKATARTNLDVYSTGEVDTALGLKQDTLTFTPENLANKGQPSGYASLGADGKIPSTQMPDLSITEFLGNFTDTTAALADTGVQASQKGDWFTVDTNGGESYVVVNNNPTLITDIVKFRTPTAGVSSVNGKVGAVVLNTDDISEGSTNKWFTELRSISSILSTFSVSGTRTAITSSDSIVQAFNKVQKYLNDLSTVAFSGSYNDLSNTPTPYSLPIASTSVLGGVKVDGVTIDIDGSGIISAMGGKISSFTSTYTAISSLSIGNSVYKFDQTYSTSDAVNEVAMLNVSGITKNSFDIALEPGTHSQFKLLLKKTGTPTDNLEFRIETYDIDGNPSGTLVSAGATGTLDMNTLTTSYVETSISSNIVITTRGQYCLVVSRSGSVDTSNYPSIKSRNFNIYNSKYNKIYNGSNWVVYENGITPLTETGFGVTNTSNTSAELWFTVVPNKRVLLGNINMSNPVQRATMSCTGGGVNVTANLSGSTYLFNGLGVVLEPGITYTFTEIGTASKGYSAVFNLVNNTNLHVTSTSANCPQLSSITSTAYIYLDHNNKYIYINPEIFVWKNLLNLTDSSDINKIAFEGLVKNSSNFFDNVTLDKLGTSETQTGLTIGKKYYLSQASSSVTIQQASIANTVATGTTDTTYGQTFFISTPTNVSNFRIYALFYTGVIVTAKIYSSIGGTLLKTANNTYTGTNSAAYIDFGFSDLLLDVGFYYIEFTMSGSIYTRTIYGTTTGSYNGGTFVEGGVAQASEDMYFVLTGTNNYSGIGNISTSPGTYPISIGESVSNIGIDIKKYINNNSIHITRDLSLAGGIVGYSHNLGKKPRTIDIKGQYYSGSALCISFGFWNGISNTCNFVIVNSTIGANTSSIFLGSNNTTYQLGTIIGITETNIYIAWAKVGSPTGTGYGHLILSE